MDMVLPLTVRITVDKRSKDASVVAFAPEIDVTSCGPTEEKARSNLREAIIIVLEEVQKKGQLASFLKELGFQKEKKGWVAPKVSFEAFLFHYSS